MFKKLVALILILAVCLPVTSCKYRRSGKPYLDYRESGTDAFVYHTERKQTETFIAFNDISGRLLLFPMNSEKRNAYDPDGLCNVTPGKAYEITYDVQYVSGGMGGTTEAFFLAVYDWNEVPIDDALFEKGFAQSGNGPMYLFIRFGYYIGEDYIALHSDDGGYDLYSREYKHKHFDHCDMVTTEISVNDSAYPIEMRFKVFRNEGQSDEYILDCLRNKSVEERDFVLLTAVDSDIYGNYYDSMEKAAVPDSFSDNLLYLYAENSPGETTRRYIRGEDLANMTAEELGLEQEVYKKIYNKWQGLSQFKRSRAKYNYDVILFTGEADLDGFAKVTYGPDLKLQLNERTYRKYDVDTRRYQYIALFVRSELNDFIPQE